MKFSPFSCGRCWLAVVALLFQVAHAHAANLTGCNVAPSWGGIAGASLSTALASGNTTLVCNGNLQINDTIAWGANTLILKANGNISINAALNGSGSAKLSLVYGQGAPAAGNSSNDFISAPVNLPAGNNFSTTLGSDGNVTNYTVINSLGMASDASSPPTPPTLQGMAATANLSGNFALGGNIDASATSGWNSMNGFMPIGSVGNAFTGTLDGLGHTISRLTITRTATDYVGLFGFLGANAAVRNLGLIASVVQGGNRIGALAGETTDSTSISNSYAAGGSTSGVANLGGLIGVNRGVIQNSYASATVTGTGAHLGVLAGYSEGSISNSYATGSLNANGTTNGKAGGLVGYNCMNATDPAGKKICLGQTTITNSYAAVTLNGSGASAGMVGVNDGVITNGYCNNGNPASNCVGSNTGTLSSVSFLTGAQMKFASGFSGFNFISYSDTGNNWVMVDGDGTVNNIAIPLSNTAVNGTKITVDYPVDGLFIAGDFVSGGGFPAGTTIVSIVPPSPPSPPPPPSMTTTITTSAAGTTASNISLTITAAGGGTIPLTNATINGTTIAVDYPVQGLFGVGSSVSGGGFPAGTTIVSIVPPSPPSPPSPPPPPSMTTTITASAAGTTGSNVSLTITAAGATYPMLASEYSSSINNAHQMQLMAMNPGAAYVLNGDIDASATAGSKDIWSGSGFVPLRHFSGSLDGLNNTISGFTINAPTENDVGMIGSAEAMSFYIRNVSLENCNVTGKNYAGCLVGRIFAGGIDTGVSVQNCNATGSVTGIKHAGGLIGEISDGGIRGGVTITNSHAAVNVTGADDTGGLAGYIFSGGIGRNITVDNSYATGKVQGIDHAGGLVGSISSGGIDRVVVVRSSYATGPVTGNNQAGGLVGFISDEGITGSIVAGNDYASGPVSGANQAGGLIGSIVTDGIHKYISVSNSFATGDVKSTSQGGGLIGSISAQGIDVSATVNNSYAIGKVSGKSQLGGLIGVLSTDGINHGATVNNSYWDMGTSGQTTSNGGTGLADVLMKQQSSFSGWDFTNTWQMKTYPVLRGMP